MLPTRHQIEREAYDRWIRRHRSHGHDRDDWIGSENELTYLLNYRSVVELPLDSSARVILGQEEARRCRFCERTVRHASFSAPRPVVQGTAEATLESAQICDECQADCRDPLAADCEILWNSLLAGADTPRSLPPSVDSLAVFKSLVTSALLIMPEVELAYCTDTLEWVSNPDHQYDGGLFAGTYCHVYRVPSPSAGSWISLARRVDDDAPFPYMVTFLSRGDIVVQIAVPMCVRDQDLDGRGARLPQRSLSRGEGPHFRVTDPTVLPLVNQTSRSRSGLRRGLIAS
jgi:Protein of unknown function (DUF2934)